MQFTYKAIEHLKGDKRRSKTNTQNVVVPLLRKCISARARAMLRSALLMAAAPGKSHNLQMSKSFE